jgi:hypothetical protein
MSRYILKSGVIEFHYGHDGKLGYYYEVFDVTRRHFNNGLIDKASSTQTMMPNLVLAEKLKKYQAPTEHIQKVLWMRKI